MAWRRARLFLVLYATLRNSSEPHQRILLSRSAIRVCQPGPVAFHFAITSAGSRNEINFLGLAETGLPPFLILPRLSISSVSSGNSSYSSDLITCAYRVIVATKTQPNKATQTTRLSRGSARE